MTDTTDTEKSQAEAWADAVFGYEYRIAYTYKSDKFRGGSQPENGINIQEHLERFKKYNDWLVEDIHIERRPIAPWERYELP